MNLKIAGGTLGAGFLIGAIFWAGAAYNRLASVEAHMASIDSQMQQVIYSQHEVGAMRAITDENSHRIEKLEDLVRQLR